MTEHSTHHHDRQTDATDPVCGMTVDLEAAMHRADYRGDHYFFCSAGCRTKFTTDPQKYLDGRAPEPVFESAIYTCPMHPKIRQSRPGNCPICGMALEPEMPTADTGSNSELLDMTRRFWIGAVLTAPVVVIEMGGHFTDGHWIDPTLSNWIQFAFATPGGGVGRLAVSFGAAGSRWSHVISTCSR